MTSTLLDMAQEVVARWEIEKAARRERGYGMLVPDREIEFAAALVEAVSKKEPVEVQSRSVWPYYAQCPACKSACESYHKFCSGCGVGLKWIDVKWEGEA